MGCYIVPYSSFGVSDISLYREYIRVCSDYVGGAGVSSVLASDVARFIGDNSDKVLIDDGGITRSDRPAIGGSVRASVRDGAVCCGRDNGESVGGVREVGTEGPTDSGIDKFGVQESATGGVTGAGECMADGTGRKLSGGGEGLDSFDGNSEIPEWRRKGCLPGETKLDRNRRWRVERKQRKARKQGRDVDSSGCVDEPRGFFSGCDDLVRKELRDSRAALLIEKNKRDLLLAQRDNRRLQSNSELVRELLRDARLKDQVVKATGKLDAHVGGWAETVVTSSSEAIISEAASREGASVPSLESLSSSVADSSSYAVRIRKTAYEKAMSELDEAYGVTIIHDEEYQDEKFRIRQEFEDVVYTPEQRVGRDLVKKLMSEVDERTRRELLFATKYHNLELALFDD